MGPLSRILSKDQVARAFGVDVTAVEAWLCQGCPHFHLRDERVLFEEAELVRWCTRRGLRRLPPLTDDVVAQIRAVDTVADVDAVADELPGLVARGVMSRARVAALREFLAQLREDIEQSRQEGPW